MNRSTFCILIYILTIYAILIGVAFADGSVFLAPKKVTYEISVTNGPHGRITPSTKSFKKGVNVTFKISPSKGYIINTITIDGEYIDLSAVKDLSKAYRHTFKKLSASHSISATFKKNLKLLPEIAILVTDSQKAFSLTDKNGTAVSAAGVIWSSDNPSIASVTNDGVVTAQTEGETSIIAFFEEGETLEGPYITSLKVVAPNERPQEIIQVSPRENLTISFKSDNHKCDPPGICLQYPPLVVNSVVARFRFEDDDILESAELFLDGNDVTADSHILTSNYNLWDGSIIVHSSISYPISDSLADGFHVVTVKGVSKAGKEVSYTWNFAKK